MHKANNNINKNISKMQQQYRYIYMVKTGCWMQQLPLCVCVPFNLNQSSLT